jgi:hypothetical protein
MAENVPAFNLADIEKKIEKRKVALHQLWQKREKLQAEVDRIDHEIQSLTNVEGARGGRRTGRRRASNATPLRPLVLQILGKNKKGLSLPGLADKVIESGYKSGANNFKNVVYQCLYHSGEVEHDSATGLYKLKK